MEIKMATNTKTPSFETLAMEKANAAIQSSRNNGKLVGEAILFAITCAVFHGNMRPFNAMASDSSGLASFDRVRLTSAMNRFNRQAIDLLFPASETDRGFDTINEALKSMASTRERYIALFDRDKDDQGNPIKDVYIIKSSGTDKDGNPDAVKTLKKAIRDNYTPETFLEALEPLIQDDKEADRLIAKEFSLDDYLLGVIRTIGNKLGPKDEEKAIHTIEALNIQISDSKRLNGEKIKAIIANAKARELSKAEKEKEAMEETESVGANVIEETGEEARAAA